MGLAKKEIVPDMKKRKTPPAPLFIRSKKINFRVTPRPEKTAQLNPTNAEIAASQINFKTRHGDLLHSSGSSEWFAAECSCQGALDNCSRCAGSGMYAKEIQSSDSTQVRQRTTSASSASPASLAKDSRGGSFAVREYGKFGSMPSFDGDQDLE